MALSPASQAGRLRVVHLCVGTASGHVKRMLRAERRHGIDAIAVVTAGVDSPDLVVDPPLETLRDLIDHADVLHVHGVSTYQALLPELRDRPFLVHEDNPLQVPHRTLPASLPLVVSVPSALRAHPRGVYLPPIILPEDLPLSRPLRDAPLRIFEPRHGSSPSTLRSTLAAILPNMRKHLGDRLETLPSISPLDHGQRAWLRATCHISIDEGVGEFTTESIEALAQGLVPVTDCDVPTFRAFELTVEATPPFLVLRTPAAIAKGFVGLVEEALCHPERFEERRAQGPEFIRAHYRVSDHIRAWRSLYEAARGLVAWPYGEVPVTEDDVSKQAPAWESLGAAARGGADVRFAELLRLRGVASSTRTDPGPEPTPPRSIRAA